MRVKNKQDDREGKASQPAKGSTFPPGDNAGIIITVAGDWLVEYDDGTQNVYSNEAFRMLFFQLQKLLPEA